MQLPALRFVKSPNYSSRGGSKVNMIVVHDCEGSFGGSVAWFQMPKSKVSAHIVMSDDGTQAVQMVDWANKAWHACDYNPMSEGIEAAGYAAKGLGAAEWQALATVVAFRLHVRGLPPVYTRGAPGGFCQHKDLGARGGGHHDITADPVVLTGFIRMVQAAYADRVPAAWISSLRLADGPLPAPDPAWKPSGTKRDDLVVGTLEWAQMELNALHLPNVPLLSVDNIDGPDTQLVVSVFQRLNGIAVTGEVDSNTVTVLKVLAGA